MTPTDDEKALAAIIYPVLFPHRKSIENASIDSAPECIRAARAILAAGYTRSEAPTKQALNKIIHDGGFNDPEGVLARASLAKWPHASGDARAAALEEAKSVARQYYQSCGSVNGREAASKITALIGALASTPQEAQPAPAPPGVAKAFDVLEEFLDNVDNFELADDSTPYTEDASEALKVLRAALTLPAQPYIADKLAEALLNLADFDHDPDGVSDADYQMALQKADKALVLYDAAKAGDQQTTGGTK